MATKSAQYPFHGWLPGAMAAPTPVSAYLHSATMVKAGIYLLARLSPVFAVRRLLAAARAHRRSRHDGRPVRCARCARRDLKLLLAFGTVSQLGFMTVLFGLGTPEAVAAGAVLLLAHGLFKATLFMVVGILDHQTGTRDIDELPPLDRTWRPVAAIAVLSAASMAGLPLLLGFIAKESAYDAVLESGLGGEWLVLAVLVAGIGAHHGLQPALGLGCLRRRRRARSTPDHRARRGALVALRRPGGSARRPDGGVRSPPRVARRRDVGGWSARSTRRRRPSTSRCGTG